MDYNLDHDNQFSIIFVYMYPWVHVSLKYIYYVNIYVLTYTLEDWIYDKRLE